MPEDKKPLEEPSEWFKDAVIDSGSRVVTCDFCGRTYFAGDEPYEDDELEILRKKAAAEPDKYIEVCGYERWGMVNGNHAVGNCPCHGLRPYEDFIWDHRYMIVDYLVERAKAEAADAAQELKRIATLVVVSE